MTLSSWLRVAAITSALASTALVAQAHEGDSKGAAQSQRVSAESLAELKDSLNLSADQQNAWTQYQTAVQPPERQRQARGADKPTLTEAQKAEINTQREAGKQARESATNAFRAQLTAEQQKIFDEQAPQAPVRRERQ